MEIKKKRERETVWSKRHEKEDESLGEIVNWNGCVRNTLGCPLDYDALSPSVSHGQFGTGVVGNGQVGDLEAIAEARIFMCFSFTPLTNFSFLPFSSYFSLLLSLSLWRPGGAETEKETTPSLLSPLRTVLHSCHVTRRRNANRPQHVSFDILLRLRKKGKKKEKKRHKSIESDSTKRVTPVHVYGGGGLK